MNAPELKNKYLEKITITNQDWLEMSPEGKYVIRAMRNNPELDWEAAENFVISEIKKAVNGEKKSAEKKQQSKNEKTISEQKNMYLFYWTTTNYMKRQNFFWRKLNPEISEQEILDSGYEGLLINVHSNTDPNFSVATSIAVDFHFARLAEDFYNEENKEKYGEDYKAEIFGKTFMEILSRVV